MSDDFTCWKIPTMVVAALTAIIATTAARAGEAFDSFIEGAAVTFDLRYRYEHVDQAGILNAANAHTLRARLAFASGTYAGFQGLIEAEGTAHLSEGFNDTVGGRASFPVVADPENLELNRIQLSYTGLPETVLTLGRQRINLDNQRFVGAVGFRQNEQTFDAIAATYTDIPGLTLAYAYIDRVNRVFGERSAQGHWDGDIHLVNGGYAISDFGKLVGYAYLIDLETARALSSQTVGLQLSGSRKIGENIALDYGVEYASQQDYGSNRASFDLDYWRAEVNLGFDAFGVLGGVESLGGDGTTGFSTPLATLHKFQGYADVFLVTPANGLADRYARLSWQTKLEDFDPALGLSVAAWYHDFEAARGGVSLGSEIDIEAAFRVNPNLALGIKYANFDGDGVFADRDKFWLSMELHY